MFVANPTDPSLPAIHYVGEAGPSSPVRHGSTSRAPARSAAIASLVLVGAIAGVGVGYALRGAPASAVAPVVHPVSLQPVPGEFRLAPGNLMPPGIVVPNRGADLEPVPGEFRLAPGNLMPPGIVVPNRGADLEPVPGEFRLAPGNLMPPGIVVPAD